MGRWKLNRRRKTYDFTDKSRELKFKKKRKSFELDDFFEGVTWVVQIAIVIVIAFVLVWYWGQRVVNTGNSMSPVLMDGDVVLADRIIYNASKPKRNDIIIFHPNGNENTGYSIKRIIGLPGETVQIKDGKIYIDGEELKETFETTEISSAGIVAEEMTLGGSEYFVLGDNRTNSEDSRLADIGNVKRSEIYGKAWFIVSGSRFGFVRN
ncbi:MAG: signal peptidase I [Hespellia sp.]|nr:signal peptidase I [Hespellia sp.]